MDAWWPNFPRPKHHEPPGGEEEPMQPDLVINNESMMLGGLG
jgi:hypothetical protein